MVASKPRFCIYIPSYNAQAFLFPTVARIPWDRLPLTLEYAVLFVDNASTDETWREVERAQKDLEARGIGNHAIRHARNRGYGGTVKSALEYTAGNGFDFVAVVHADGQYAPEELPRLVSELLARPADALHFGSRLTGAPLQGGMPVYKYLGNRGLSFLQNLVLGTSLSEFHSGYRLYRMEYMRRIPYQRNSDGFVFDNQIVFQIRHWGYGISESPIPTFYGEEKSHVPRIGTPLAILGSLAEYALHKWGIRRVSRYSS